MTGAKELGASIACRFIALTRVWVLNAVAIPCQVLRANCALIKGRAAPWEQLRPADLLCSIAVTVSVTTPSDVHVQFDFLQALVYGPQGIHRRAARCHLVCTFERPSSALLKSTSESISNSAVRRKGNVGGRRSFRRWLLEVFP